MSNAAVRRQAVEWLQQGRGAVVVEVLRVQGSVPREAGCRMVVSADDQLGTIGGGHLEWHALHEARRALSKEMLAPVQERHALGPSLGQCCGGVVELRYSMLDAAAVQAWPTPAASMRLCLYGAGHVGAALARTLAELDAEVDWIDVREDVFPESSIAPWVNAPGIRRIVSDSPAHEARHHKPDTLHVVMTHSHALDFDIVESLLRRDDVAWVGLIGSKTKRARFEHRLLDRGLPAHRLRALCCPIGIPGITGKAPAVVAVAVAAQLLMLSSSMTGMHQSGVLSDVASIQQP